MPKISVIIPIYNVEKYLRQCLDSVVNQTIKDIEIICVNDGSTDNSQAILNEYAKKDERFVVINQVNQGLSVARNNGLNSATGKYVAFIDSDDYLLNNNYFEKLYNACEKYNADIAVAGIIRGNNRSSKYIYKVEKEEVTNDYKDKLLLCDVPDSNYVWNKLYKRESLLATGIIFPPGKLYEDLYYTHKVLYYMDRLVSVPDVAIFYRKRSDSIVKTKNIQADIDKQIGDREIRLFFEKHGINFSQVGKVTKKYKFFGLTLFKKVEKRGKCKNILFNTFCWNS
ncbi:glycosyltransferase [bacterium]|nr:glycosyltransferase [bacterium]